MFPGATEEQAEVGEEPVEVAETRISLTNVVGSVFRAHRLQIVIDSVECFFGAGLESTPSLSRMATLRSGFSSPARASSTAASSSVTRSKLTRL